MSEENVVGGISCWYRIGAFIHRHYERTERRNEEKVDN